MYIMAKRNIITICGVLGSGKSTTAKRVASTLGYAHYSGGDFMRAMATERGITLAELNVLAETDPAIDKEIDRKQKEFMDTNDNFVIDSRLGWFWAEDSFKVFLTLPVSSAAERVFADMQAKKAERANEMTTTPETFEEVQARLAERFASEGARYKKYYDIDNYQDPVHFDLVIDTSVNDIPKVEQLVIEGYKKWQNS
jgi:CMP/dCMP kinase